jgi:hypothetical protein
MRRLLSIALSTTLSSSLALAAEPVIVQSPMTPDTLPGGARGAESSDLPAPDTTAIINRPLLITSAIVLVGAYVPMAAVAFTSDRSSDQTNLYYPVVGPWMNLASRCDTNVCNDDTVNKVLLVADGIGQGLGAVGLVASFFVAGKTTRHWYLIGNNEVHAAPGRVGLSGYGFSAAGTF